MIANKIQNNVNHKNRIGWKLWQLSFFIMDYFPTKGKK